MSRTRDWESRFADFAAGFAGQVRQQAPMREYTSWQIGGPADWLLEPCDYAGALSVMEYCQREEIPLTVIGRGTNLLVSDKGIRGVVLRIGENLSRVEYLPGGLVCAEAGVLLAALSRQTAEDGLSGLEWACGIPGNLGGALMMNAGAYGSSIGEYVTEVEAAAYNEAENKSAVLQRLSGEQLHFGYRSGCLAPGMVALRVTLRLRPGNAEKSLAEIAGILQSRRQNQPLDYPSAGSVFRNPEGSHAGYLIEQAGCKGLTVGGAQVSEKHGNFIINMGGATAADVLALIDKVQGIVAAKSGYELEREVRLLGEGAD